MRVNRYFTSDVEGAYDKIEFVEGSSAVRDKDGTIVRELTGLLVPSHWSQLSIDMCAEKYLHKRGVPDCVEHLPEEGVPIELQLRQPAKNCSFGMERDFRCLFDRIAGHLAYTGLKFGQFVDPEGNQEQQESALIFFEELRYMLAHQIFAPNSPQWFNTGLWWAYRIKGQPSGLWASDCATTKENTIPRVGSIQERNSSYIKPQAHACFIQSIEDTLLGENGIMSLFEREARVFKFGSGSGTNYSKLRAKGEKLRRGGVSSGLMSFLTIGDRVGGAIKSGGTTRRAARMVVVDVDHPEIFKFINWKLREERKVAALVSGHRLQLSTWEQLKYATKTGGNRQAIVRRSLGLGVPSGEINRMVALIDQGVEDYDCPVLDTSFEGEAYQTVDGQNANNSVRVNGIFMKSVKSGSKYPLHHRTEPQEQYWIDARDVWQQINHASWSCADPGLQFHDNINDWNTCAEDGEIRATNPCGEYNWHDDTGCNLASVNLMKFAVLDDDSKVIEFNSVGFAQACKIGAIALDVTIDLAGYPSQDIARGSYRYRTFGLGYANLGGLLMSFGIPYDSIEGRAFCCAITSIMNSQAWYVSAKLAQTGGTFETFERNKKHVMRVIRNHASVVLRDEKPEGLHNINCATDPSEIDTRVRNAYQKILEFANKSADWMLAAVSTHGVRNAQVSLLAPTGTIGLVMGCDTTGIEPDFSLVKWKKLAGGGAVKIVNRCVVQALRTLNYHEDEIAEISDYVIGHPGDSLRNAPHDFFARASDQIGSEEVTIDVLGLSMDVRLVVPDAQAFGYSAEQWDEINQYVCGTGTIEGAPGVDSGHYPVFDCANRCGSLGTRSIDPEAHLCMMAAAQGSLSGAISKTVNLPEDTLIERFKELHLLAWELGLKCVALYRDGSKLNQPLSSRIELEDVPEESPAPKFDRVVRVGRAREHLPNRRKGYTQKVKIGSQSVFLRTGEYQDGRLGEIFLDLSRQGSSLRTFVNCFAVAVSIGLQHGVPLADYVEAFLHTRFEPSGVVQGHDQIKLCSSVVDYVFKELAINYLNREDLANTVHVDDDEVVEQELVTSTVSENGEQVRRAEGARRKGYQGEACSQCGSFEVVRNGACLLCRNCGATTGC